MSYRTDAVRASIKEWKAFPNGRPDLYYQETGGDPGSDWCGMYVLRNLQRAGLAKGVKWIQGIGFISPLKLPRVAVPLPGDVVVIPQPFQHQAMVVSYEPSTGMVTSIDGNTPGIETKVRFVKNGNIEFYSIQPLIDAAERAASSWGYVLGGALIVGAAAYAYLNPAPFERLLKRIGI